MNCSVSVGLLCQLLDEFAAVEAAVEMKLSSSIRTSIGNHFFVRFHSFLTCVVTGFPLTLLLYIPVSHLAAYDL